MTQIEIISELLKIIRDPIKGANLSIKDMAITEEADLIVKNAKDSLI